MTTQQARRLLLVALAISLLIHALIAARIGWPFAPPHDTVQVEQIEHIRFTRIARQPTPPPATPVPSPAPHLTTKTTSTKPAKNGNGPVQVASAPAPVPTPAASATPNCFKSDSPATIMQTPDPPEITTTARGTAFAGNISVLVKLDPNGVVADATVPVTSGNTSFDVVAIGLAKRAIYAPATHECKGIASEYTFIATFSPL